MTIQQHTIQKRMVEVIDRQLAQQTSADYVLKMGPAKLEMVRKFVLSFILEQGDRVIPYMGFPEPENTAEPERNQPAVAELAERLAKVEDRLATNESALRSQMQRVEKIEEQRLAAAVALRGARKALDDRIDKVAEIVGERISGLVDQIDKLEGPAGWLDNMQAEINSLKEPTVEGDDGWRDAVTQALDGSPAINAGWWRERPNTARPYFPTGGAHTAEAAADAVLPVPQRGDRVRLEGAHSLSNGTIPDGWYDVIGAGMGVFQVAVPVAAENRHPSWLTWISSFDVTVKEVRHADH